MTTDLRGHLEDCEFAGPCSESALAMELTYFGIYIQRGLDGGLVGEIFQLRTGDPEQWAASAGLAQRDSPLQIPSGVC